MNLQPAIKDHASNINEQCPVTGLRIHCRPGWTLVDCGDDFRSTVYVIENDIVVCRPYGNATARSVAVALDMARTAVREIVGPDRPYVKIEDYANLGRVPSDARKLFADYIKSEPLMQCQIFCNVSSLMRISIKLGKRVTMIPVPVEIVDTFEEAVLMAQDVRQAAPLPAVRQPIKYSADPFAEYESAGVCPVSGFEVTHRPEWTDIRIGQGSHASFKWIGPRILHVTLRGKMDAAGIEALERHKIRAVADWQADAEPYLEIIDASAAVLSRKSCLFSLFQTRPTGTPHQGPVAGIVVQAGLFYAAKAFLLRLLMPFVPKIMSARNYKEAVLKAQKFLNRLGYGRKVAYETVSLPEWDLKLPGFTTRFEIINGSILHGLTAGMLEAAYVQKIFDIHYRLVEHMGPSPQGYAVVSGIRDLRSVSLAARKGYIEGILDQHRRYPLNQFIFYGANLRLRAMVNLARPLIPFPLKMVKDLDSALKLIAQTPPGRSAKLPTPEPDAPETGDLKRYADDLINYMGRINWEADGMDTELMQVDPLNPLRPAYEAIALIKMDLDYLQQERRKAERSLVESEAKYHTMLDRINEGYFEIDLKYDFIFFNDATCRIFGFRPEELMHVHIGDLLAPADLESALKAFDSVKNTPGSYQMALWQYCRKDGSACHIETSVTPIVADGGGINGFRGLFRDVTQRMEAEAEKLRLEARLQQAKKMEALGTLAGGVAHDLNNLLTGLVSYPDMLLQQLPPGSPLTKGLETIRKSGQKAATIVQDLLALARRGVTRTEILNINHIIRDYVDSLEFANLIRHHDGVDIKLNLSPDVLNLCGSPVHLSKAIMNLVTNAAEAMPDGGTICISTRNILVDASTREHYELGVGEYVSVTVTDSGIGISAEDRQRIFEPFYTKKVMGRSGTGLGMAVVWGTVQDHNGHIALASEKDKGTEITLFFPAIRCEIATEKAPDPIETYLGNGETILVVDDQQMQREVLGEMLVRLGYSVETVKSGEDAVAYMQTHSADLLILDMIMDPGIDGYETYRRVLKLHPDQKAILCSGYSESDQVRMARKLGAGAYLRKPYSIEQLGKTVQSELRQQIGVP